MGLLKSIKEMFGMSTESVNVTKIKEKSIGMGSMASACQTEAMNVLNHIHSPIKILMLQHDEYNQDVSDYALKLSQKLDCDIIALSISDKPLSFSGDRKDREIEKFMYNSEKDMESFLAKSNSMGISVDHQIKIGDMDTAIYELTQEDSGIRYILNKTNTDNVKQDRKFVPVCDVACSRIQPRAEM